MEEQKKKEELQRRKYEQENLDKQIKMLQEEHNRYKELKVQELYNKLPFALQKNIDTQFSVWLRERKVPGFAIPEDIFKLQFLAEILLEKKDIDFEEWAANKGILVKKIGKKYQLATLG